MWDTIQHNESSTTSWFLLIIFERLLPITVGPIVLCSMQHGAPIMIFPGETNPTKWPLSFIIIMGIQRVTPRPIFFYSFFAGFMTQNKISTIQTTSISLKKKTTSIILRQKVSSHTYTNAPQSKSLNELATNYKCQVSITIS